MRASVRRYDNASDFFAAVQPLSLAHEIENALFLGVAKRLAGTGEADLLIAVECGGRSVAAALQSSPYGLSLCMAQRRYIERLAEALADREDPISGVLGVERHAGWFAERFAAGRRVGQRTQLAMVLYALSEVLWPPAPAAGSMRAAVPADREWLIDWMVAFAEEGGLPAFERQRGFAAGQVDRSIADGRRFVWEDRGEPVATALFNPTGLNAARIGGVRTAPQARGRGYASVLTAALARHLRTAGCPWVALFADQGNPLSNRIYRRLGFRPVCRVRSIEFTIR